MGASASTPEAEPDAPSYWPSLTVRTSCSPPEPSTPVAPPTTPNDAPPRRSWGWSEVFGALVEQRVIEAIPTHKVDSMQGMWQRALRAKTAAIDKLRDELDSAYARVHELEMERDARDAAEKFADTRPLERETERSHLEAQSTAMSILRELRSDVEEREKRLVALTDALRRASMNAAEHERAVFAARDETRVRGERFRDAESFLHARLTEVTNELKQTRDACEVLTKDAREGEAVLSELSSGSRWWRSRRRRDAMWRSKRRAAFSRHGVFGVRRRARRDGGARHIRGARFCRTSRNTTTKMTTKKNVRARRRGLVRGPSRVWRRREPFPRSTKTRRRRRRAARRRSFHFRRTKERKTRETLGKRRRARCCLSRNWRFWNRGVPARFRRARPRPRPRPRRRWRSEPGARRRTRRFTRATRSSSAETRFFRVRFLSCIRKKR